MERIVKKDLGKVLDEGWVGENIILIDARLTIALSF